MIFLLMFGIQYYLFCSLTRTEVLFLTGQTHNAINGCFCRVCMLRELYRGMSKIKLDFRCCLFLEAVPSNWYIWFFAYFESRKELVTAGCVWGDIIIYKPLLGFFFAYVWKMFYFVGFVKCCLYLQFLAIVHVTKAWCFAFAKVTKNKIRKIGGGFLCLRWKTCNAIVLLQRVTGAFCVSCLCYIFFTWDMFWCCVLFVLR